MKNLVRSSILISFIFFGFSVFAQNKPEREHRIKKSQFPVEAIQFIEEQNDDFKRLKFYREVDSLNNKYTVKFKKDRLFYEVDFNQKSELTGVGFAIKPIDIPEENFQRMSAYLSRTFDKVKVRKMFQIYLSRSNEDRQIVMKNAFQNLMLPNMVYELFVKGEKNSTRSDFEITFDAKGNFIHSKKALPANYDRVLY